MIIFWKDGTAGRARQHAFLWVGQQLFHPRVAGATESQVNTGMTNSLVLTIPINAAPIDATPPSRERDRRRPR